ncbi:hypothetical protein FHW23_001183 [Curtobacterium pusillum]|uniref:Uncharacterized protein n=1 Tax=Curtobacterium pusillum TaxID=69373 RepID=A0AAW3T659_9MICO|nr:hypothetical protein [Curtobacterium pusillum]MBA8989937.1 hypothetical protein [Curtobacterium pusillum]
MPRTPGVVDAPFRLLAMSAVSGMIVEAIRLAPPHHRTTRSTTHA